jgi:hypothetical protein
MGEGGEIMEDKEKLDKDVLVSITTTVTSPFECYTYWIGPAICKCEDTHLSIQPTLRDQLMLMRNLGKMKRKKKPKFTIQDIINMKKGEREAKK